MFTKTLISRAVTAQLICIFVFAYAESRFSNDAAHIFLDIQGKTETVNAYSEEICLL